MKFRSLVLSVALVLIGCLSMVLADSGIPQRSDIDIEDRWNLADIYPTLEAWEKDYAAVESGLQEFKSYRGTLKKSGANIHNCLKLDDEVSIKIDNIYVYAGLKKDEDTRISENQGLMDRAAALLTKYSEATAFIVPELQTIPEKKIYKFIAKTPGLEIYRHFFDNLIRQRSHTLSSQEDEILAMAGDLFRASRKIHEAITVADMVFPMVEDEDGNEIRLTRGRYSLMLLSQNPDVRRRAFLARTEAFDKVKNTNAATFDANLKKDRFLARVRKYNSTLEMALETDNVPIEVFDNLLGSAYNNVDALNRYMEMRRNVLGLEEIHLYDTSVPIVEDVDLKIPYEEAVETLLKAFEPMGEEYVEKAREGFNLRWIDVYETEGKSTGAYS
ncbi:MAG: hypothetical protein HQ528_04015 [Candidatus Marinimicrobia bacterium]|nr:hypothetical protein [Candidatus Neomarinimicrobiota bacterium]